MMQPALIFQNVQKKFSDCTVLKGVDGTIASGESVAVIGQSGSGKSVLLKCVLGLIPFDEGDIVMEGESIKNESRRQRERRLKNVGVVFQSSALFDSLSVLDNVAFGLIYAHHYSWKKAQDIALEKLKSVGLPATVAPLYPCEISGGMQRRVALARAIAFHPQFLFFDEPTSGLDPIFSQKISQLIRSCVTNLKATAITITHDLKSVPVLADRVLMLHEGSIVWSGDAAALATCTHPIVRQFTEGKGDEGHF